MMGNYFAEPWQTPDAILDLDPSWKHIEETLSEHTDRQHSLSALLSPLQPDGGQWSLLIQEHRCGRPQRSTR
jgi:hypothetical protein